MDLVYFGKERSIFTTALEKAMYKVTEKLILGCFTIISLYLHGFMNHLWRFLGPQKIGKKIGGLSSRFSTSIMAGLLHARIKYSDQTNKSNFALMMA